MRRLAAIVAAVLCAVLCAAVLTGCSEEPAPKPVKETRQLSKARFLERGNEICRRGARELERRAGDVDTSRPAKARRAVQKVIVPSIREQAADLRALRGPARLERQLEPLLDDTDRILDFLAEDPSRYSEVDLLFVDVNRGLTSLGLAECGR